MQKLQNRMMAHLVNSWWVYIFVALFFVAGIIFGSLGVTALSNSQITQLVSFMDQGLQNIQAGKIGIELTIKQSIWSNLIALFKIWVLGLTVIGFPLVLAIIFSRGFTLGFTIGFLFQQKSWQGLMLIIFSIFPSNLLLIPSILIAAVAAINFSFFLIRGGQNRKNSIQRQVAGYCGLMLILSLIVVTAGVIEGYAMPTSTKLLGW